ncbi:hypothetical protein GCM10023189_41090 [Nibrella saemangeumensis]|uniref:Signal transducer regulating beta-lactamase production, contains metallopeptidase domain n=1 Tax=Nibrella saemangeumensis TaxID=1084526 RepID=A0ABP8NBX3_9BACT
MIVYLLKMTACSGILLLVYLLFLEREKMHQFNRFYLLFAIVFSGAVPLISVDGRAPLMPDLLNRSVVTQHVQPAPTVPTSPASIRNPDAPAVVDTEKPVPFTNMFYWVYAFITAGFLLRFGRNLVVLVKKAVRNPVARWQGTRVVLLREDTPIYSFFNTIYVNENDFRQQRIEAELLAHETAHIHQKHSLDILFMELVLAFGWLNPVLFLYRKAIELNHEFLADEAVNSAYGNPKRYQHLLLAKLRTNSEGTLTSRFNFSGTKKRMIMITKSSNPAGMLLKKVALAPVIFVVGFLFSEHSQAQEKTKPVPRLETKAAKPESVGQGASPAELEDYERIVKEAKLPLPAGQQARFPRYGFDWGHEGREVADQIFRKMTSQQQANATQARGFAPIPTRPPKKSPSPAYFESLKNGKKYAIWIHDRPVSNSALNRYKPSDFAYSLSSYVYNNARSKRFPQPYQVSLLTEAEYEKLYKGWNAPDNKAE